MYMMLGLTLVKHELLIVPVLVVDTNRDRLDVSTSHPKMVKVQLECCPEELDHHGPEQGELLPSFVGREHVEEQHGSSPYSSRMGL